MFDRFGFDFTGYSHHRLIRIALLLSIITIGYNMVEAAISLYFGWADDTISLFGFGADSFVEVLSGVGIAHMMIRMKRSGNDPASRDRFERTALKITGSAFYLLTTGLVVGSILRLVSGSAPDTTMVGIIISLVSIATMYLLLKAKIAAGNALNSDAILADAECTRTCFYLSFILLFASLFYELFHLAHFDIAGSLGIAWFAFREGREAWEKARSDTLSCHC